MEIAKKLQGRPRNGKACRLRWCNQLDPAVNRGPFSELEEAIVIVGQQVGAPNTLVPVLQTPPGDAALRLILSAP